jgi:hypothetical protein
MSYLASGVTVAIGPFANERTLLESRPHMGYLTNLHFYGDIT